MHQRRGNLALLFSFLCLATALTAQTATYHLHREASAITGTFDKLLTAGPDAASLAITAPLTSKAAGEYVIKEFETQSGVPNSAGVVPSGSTLTFNLFMRKTANVGTVFPRARLGLNNAAGTPLCTATGTTALTTTVSKQTLSCITSANVTMSTTDRFYLWVGVNLTVTSATAFNGELDVEGNANGNFDSQVIVPLGRPAPTITSLAPNTGAIGTSVVIAGTNFRDLQVSSTVTFNGVPSTPTSWSGTSITAPVPPGATTGPVVVTVGGQASAGVPFTVTPAPSIASLAPNSGAIGSAIIISGSNFGPSQGNGSVKFNGTTATVTNWTASSIAVTVPTGATTGNVVVTAAGGVASNGVAFTVTPAPHIASLTPGSGAAGDSISIAGTNFGASQGNGIVTFNGVPALVAAWSTTSITAAVPAGATTGNVVVTAAGGISSDGVRFKVLNPGGLAIDQIVSADNNTLTAAVTTAAFSTSSANEVLLAFVSSGRNATTATTTHPVVTSVTGGGLTWVLVQRTNVQPGTSEIWRAFASGPLTNVTVTANFSQPVLSSVTVVSFTGADISGTNASGAIGAVGTGSAATGLPTATLTTTRNGSLVFGVGDDPISGVARKPAANQVIVHQVLCAPGVNCPEIRDTLWVQQVATPVASSGTSVTVSDTAPATDPYNLSIVEVLPAVAGNAAPVINSLSPTAGPIGTLVTINGSNFGATKGTSTVTFGGITAIPSVWSATQIQAPVPAGVALGPVPVVVTVPGAGASNAATFTVVTPLTVSAIAAPAANANNWNNTNVTISYICSGGVPPVVCPGQSVVTTEGANQVITATAVDANGSQASVSVTLNIDKTNPVITAAVAPPAVNGVVTAPATVTFTCTDALSGVASCPAPIAVTTAGLNQTFSGTATDRAGNSATASITFSVQTAPLKVTAAAAPPANAANWNNSNVTVTFTCSGGVPPVTCPATNVVTTEGANQIISGSATDAAGQTASASVTLNIDKTNPTITATVSPLAVNGVVTAPATVTFTCSDALSGVAVCPSPISVTTAGLNQTFSGTATDRAGNSATASITFSVELSPLTVTASAAPPANAANWNNTDVTVTFTCSGGVPPVICPATQLVSTEGANQIISGSATDAAGQTASASVTLNIDKTSPTITATVSPLAVNGVVTAPATVTFICTDALSGVAVCPSPISVTTAGLNQTFSGTATDRAGNSATASITFSVELAPLTVTASVAPPANAANWNNTNVTVTFTCSGGVAPVQCPASQLVSTEGANQIISGTATDAAGQTASASVTLNIDKTPPIVSVTSPANNATVASASLQLAGSVTDALSGVATVSCNGIAAVVQGGALTCSVTLVTGPNSLTVTATDVAGNTSTQSLSVTLVALSVTDFNPRSAPIGTLITLTGTNLTSGGNPLVLLNAQGGGTIAATVTAATASSLSFIIPAGAATGLVTVTTGSQSASSTATLAVVASSGFTLSVGPSAASVMQSKTASYQVSIDSANGFTQLASLSVSGLPSGLSASFVPQQIAAGQFSILTITTSATQPLGTVTFSVSASAAVDGIPNTQSASATLTIQPITTSLFGRTLESDTVESPLGGINITLLGLDDAGHTTACTGKTVSDAAGNFSFTNLPPACVGRQLVAYEGDHASDGEKYASVNLAYTLIGGQATGPEMVHLPRIDNGETKMVTQNSTVDQTFNFSTMPGVSVTIYAGTIFTMPDGTRPDPFPLTGVQVPVDRLPDTPVDGPGTLRAYIIAFQPADTTTNQPVAVTFPNTLNTPPGVNMELDTLDPVVGELVKYGTGTVNGDGTSIVPDADPASPGHRFGITHFDWHGPMAPGPNGNNPGGGGHGPDDGGSIDLASGLEVARHTDVMIRGGTGGFHLTRTYRTLSGAPGPFGVGTNHNLGYQLDTFAFIQGQGIITMIMPDGNQFAFSRQPDGTYINTVIPSLQGAVMSPSPGFGLFTLRFKGGTVFQFQNPPTGARVAYLSSIADGNGNLTSLVRNNPNSPIQITEVHDPAGRQILFNYDNFDRITQIIDPIGRRTSYTYNQQGTLASVTDPNSGVTRYNYDPQNRLANVIDPRGVTTYENFYDGNGRVIRQVRADGGVTNYAFTLVNPSVPTSPVALTTVTDPRGRQTIYRFNSQGFLTDVTDPTGQIRTLQRDPGTNLVTAMQGTGQCEVCGDPSVGDFTLTYDANGNITSHTDLFGNASRFAYDPVFNEATSFTDEVGNQTTFTYDAHGNLSTMTDALGRITTFTYNSHGQMIKTVAPGNRTTTFTYDAAGNVKTVTDPAGNTSTAVYDAVSRLVQQQDAFGNVITYGYDNNDHVISITDQRGKVTRFSYDAAGDLVSLTDPDNNTSTIYYNGMQQAIKRTDPRGFAQTYSFDLAGNFIGTTDRRGQTATFQYDALNRLIQEDYVDASVSRVYDASGRLVAAKDSKSGNFTFAYDGAGRLVGAVTPFGSIHFTRDPAGRVTARTVQGEPQVTYQYDAVGNLTSASVPQGGVTMSYDNRNLLQSIARSNGLVTDFSYDALGRLLSRISHNGANVLSTQNYTYDAAGRRSSQTTDLGQSLITAAATATYGAGNRLTQFATHSYTYDENGNLLTDTTPSGQTVYTWDGRNHLQSITAPDGTTVSYLYDFAGSLIQQHTKGNAVDLVQTYVLDDLTNISEELDNGTKVSYLNGRAFDQVYGVLNAGGQLQFAMTGSLGNVVASSGSSGLIDGRTFYEPFGQTTSQVGATVLGLAAEQFEKGDSRVADKFQQVT